MEIDFPEDYQDKQTLKNLRNMVGCNDEVLLRKILSGAGGDLNIAINHYFSSCGVVEEEEEIPKEEIINDSEEEPSRKKAQVWISKGETQNRENEYAKVG